jgi:nucleotide-binding universal stress UspA family protein
MTDRHILVPIDDSDHAWDALNHALAQYAGQQITVLHVIDPLAGDYELDEPDATPTKRSERVRDRATERVTEVDGSTDFEFVVAEGRPAHEILDYAEEADVDQIVIGNRGHSGLKKVLLGSVSETVVRRASVPVTIVR